MKRQLSNPELSIVILNYNTKKHTIECVGSIEANYEDEVKSGKFQVIIADNASSDGSLEEFKDYKKKSKITNLEIVDNKNNIGFAAGNNRALTKAKGNYILFLNPDTIVYKETLNYVLNFLKSNTEIGAATCKIEIPDGRIDESSHRGFPTPWNSFAHFSGLQYLFPKSKLFAGYTQGWKNINKSHVVDAISGAFMMVPSKVGELVGWWDEDYFFYGEDLDFCYRIGQAGFKIYYLPDVSILHYGGVSSGIKKQSQTITTASKEHSRKVQGWRFDAMRIFYNKHYSKRYAKIVNWLVMKGINFLHKKHTKF